jgi:hypothetical protein
MKIRHKQSGVELEGDFVRVSESYFRMPLSIPHGGSCYAASEWEAVPEWVNVTGACELLQGIRLWHGEKAIADLSNGYRFRKVQVSIFGFPKWAFIVERKA